MNFGIDKVKHFAVGLIVAVAVTFLAYHALHYFDLYHNPSGKIFVASTQLLAVGLAGNWKERKDDYYDWWDMIFTLIPGVFFLVIVLIYF